MTDAGNSTYESLAEEIMADARLKADRARSRGEKDAEKIRDRAAREADGARKTVLEQARERSEREGAIIIAGIEVEAKRQALELKERSVHEVLDLAREMLAQGQGYDRRASLGLLAAEAVAAMRATSIVLEVSPTDKETVGPDFVGDVCRRAGREAHLELREADIPGGVIATSADGREIYDNSFPARLRRLTPALRVSIADGLFDSQGQT
jgi:vacuolar-type H+-ATPase subunit E/Vma4